MEREITLRDYGRVLWSGRWVLLVAAVTAALIGLITSLVRETTYSASSIVYLGLATTAKTGVPVPTPLTTQVTAQRVLRADQFLQAAADAAGVPVERVRDGVNFSVDRVPGAAGGTQPTVATIHYEDTDRETAIKVANAYADVVFGFVKDSYSGVLDAYQKLVDDGNARVKAIQAELDRLRRQGSAAPQSVISSLTQELSMTQLDVDDNTVSLVKTKQIEQPYVISKATSAASSGRPGQRLRSVVFGAILGLIVGVIIVFIWRGSPAGRADDA